jgi:hypothetical protein
MSRKGVAFVSLECCCTFIKLKGGEWQREKGKGKGENDF